jgi:hypothetical protein
MATFVDLIDVATSANGTALTQSRTYGAGERVLVWARWITVGGATPSVTDGTNTYTQIGTTLSDVANTGSDYAVFECKNTASGTFTVSFNLSLASTFRAMGIARYSGLDTSVNGVGARQAQASPGTGADAVSSTNLTPGSQPGVLVGFGYDDGGGGAVSAGTTGFTSRGTMSNMDTAFGTTSRVEDKAITSTSAVAATFTGTIGTDNYIAFAVYFPDSASDTLMAQACL